MSTICILYYTIARLRNTRRELAKHYQYECHYEL